MKKRELRERAAELKAFAPAMAADDLAKAVNRIIKALKNGRSARLPGLGTITPNLGVSGRHWVFRRESRER